MKEIIDKLDFTKIKYIYICSAKGNIKRMRKKTKNKPTGWETVHLKKELLLKIYKEWLKLKK